MCSRDDDESNSVNSDMPVIQASTGGIQISVSWHVHLQASLEFSREMLSWQLNIGTGAQRTDPKVNLELKYI